MLCLTGTNHPKPRGRDAEQTQQPPLECIWTMIKRQTTFALSQLSLLHPDKSRDQTVYPLSNPADAEPEGA